MDTGRLHIDTNALCKNWLALDDLNTTQTGAVVKANGYGLGADLVGAALSNIGVKTFFVASSQEGVFLRNSLGSTPKIYVFSGHMEGATQNLEDYNLTPLLNSTHQVERHMKALPKHAFGVQLDTGMNRLGLECEEWHDLRKALMSQGPKLVMSHLACADEPEHPMNIQQLKTFKAMSDGIDAPRSLAATGGLLLGADYHFDLCRPGIGLYGGLPFKGAVPVIKLELPVIQTRIVKLGESVGYGNHWVASKDTRVATLSGGYADGLSRMLSSRATFWHEGTPCPLLGRVSMDMIAVDISSLEGDIQWLSLICPEQNVDQLASDAHTIGYEILTSLGERYTRIITP